MTVPHPQSNAALVADFRYLLAKGVWLADEHGFDLPDADRARFLLASKPWREAVWSSFRELERRLCPTTPAGGPR